MYVCPAQDPSGHQTVLGTTFFTLAVFVVLYVLVYVECLVRRWLRASALLIWVCLMMLGYVLVFDSWIKTTHMGAQVTGWGDPGVPRGWMPPPSCAPRNSCLHSVCWPWAFLLPRAMGL